MEKNNEPFFKQNSIFGCLIGATFIFASLLFILAGKGIVVNAQFHNIIMMLTIFGIFMGVRKYRDEQLAGVISYGKALKTGIYILCVVMLCRVRILFILVQRGFTDGIQKRDNKHAKDYRTELPTVQNARRKHGYIFCPRQYCFRRTIQ